jgi:imidazole glycerol phosphate synthase glutamine amidotransferase subunit
VSAASKPVVVIDTGVANIASMLAALRRLGASPSLTDSADTVREAERLVLPGVGAFGAGLARLRDLDLEAPIVERIQGDRGPVFCVCLGLQMLCEASEESPGVAGLGVVGAEVRRFSSALRVPQLGWNMVTPAGQGERALTEPGHAYFANSYRLDALPEGYGGATADYGGPFVAALERGDLVACQFHPELSGDWGHGIMERWLAF